jgi:predicted metal-dependent HD superfamily phosphohydrolase
VTDLDPERWSQLWSTATKAVPPMEYFERLLAMYSEPHRRYHNCHHIADCLHEFNQVRQLAADPLAVELAIWFHDAVCDSHAADNEERSAELAKDWMGKFGADAALGDSVGQLILATKSHDSKLHVDAPLLVDVDLSILGQTAEWFWKYEGQIRMEFEWAPENIFATKRAEILDRFLACKRIYSTEHFFGRYEKRARVNLIASL